MTQPAGAGGLIGPLLGGSELLIGVVQTTPITLRTGGAAMVGQDLCVTTEDLPNADFSGNPTITFDAPLVTFVVNGTDLPIEDITFEGTYSQSLDNQLATFAGLLDTRDYSTVNFGLPDAACANLAAIAAVNCVPCVDGQSLCIDLEITQVLGTSEPTTLVERTPADVAADPTCP